MTACLAVKKMFRRFPPPLQTDFTEHGLADKLADLGDFGVEPVKRGKRAAWLFLDDEQAQIALEIEAAQLFQNPVEGRLAHLSPHK